MAIEPHHCPHPPRYAVASSHLPALDGVRGLAILMVLACHFYRKDLLPENAMLTAALGRLFGIGALGVELFFVLSGFLITGILVDHRQKKGSLLNFYARRTLRIFPLYFLSLAVVLIVLPHLVTFDPGASRISENQVWLWTYAITWGGAPWVWDDSKLFLLGHFWSLCVEEHFYLIWPPLVYLLSRRNLAICCLAFVAVGLMTRTVGGFYPDEAPMLFQWLTLQKLDGLAVGSLLALALRSSSARTLLPEGRNHLIVLWMFATTSLILMMWPRGWHSPIVPVIRETVTVATFGLVLLWTLRLESNQLGHRILSGRALTILGKYSYGIYVIHGILRPSFRAPIDNLIVPIVGELALLHMTLYIGLASAMSLLLALISFHAVEGPFLSLKRYFQYKSTPSN